MHLVFIQNLYFSSILLCLKLTMILSCISSMYMLSYLFPDVLSFPYSTHWMHLLNNCTTNLEGSVASFASKMYSFFSTRGNLSCIFSAAKDVTCNYKLRFIIHLFIWIRSIFFICRMVVMASSLLVLELYWLFAMSICPRDSEIVFPSTSSSPFSSEDIYSRTTLFNSLDNLFLSVRFVS
jgi:hypothetical protein